MDTNNDIRAYALTKGVYIYEIAERFGIAPTSMSRKLHNKIKPYVKDYIFKIIDEIAERKAAARAEAV